MSKHYHVLVARAAAKAEAEHLADSEHDEESGTKATVVGGPNRYTLEIENASPTHLRTYVEVASCDDESCKDEE
jgi:hypothetical protein